MTKSNEGGKWPEQDMQLCLKKKRMQEIWGCVKRVKKIKVMVALHICGVTNTLPWNLDGSRSYGLLLISCIFKYSYRLRAVNSCISTYIYLYLYLLYYGMRLTLFLFYLWFSEYQNPMETNCSRAPFGDMTNHTNGGN